MNTINHIPEIGIHDAVSQGIPLAGGAHNTHKSIALGVIRGRRLRSQTFCNFIYSLSNMIYRGLIKHRST